MVGGTLHGGGAGSLRGCRVSVEWLWGADDAGIVASPEVIEFGKVAVGDTVTREFAVRNESRSRARVYAASHPDGLELVPPFVELERGDRARLQLVFSPTRPMDLSGSILLGDAPPLHVEGLGVDPAIEVTERVDFGVVGPR